MELLNYVGGQYLSPSSGEWIDVLAPVDGSVLARVPDSGADDVDRAVVAARTAFETTDWRHRTPAARADVLRAMADELERRVPELSGTLIRDVGCPARLSRRFVLLLDPPSNAPSALSAVTFSMARWASTSSIPRAPCWATPTTARR